MRRPIRNRGGGVSSERKRKEVKNRRRKIGKRRGDNEGKE